MDGNSCDPSSVRSVADTNSSRQAANLEQEWLKLAVAKEQFLSNLSHELRTPLTSVLGLSKLLLEGVAGPLGDKQNQYVGIIQEQGMKMLTVINNLLDLAALEAGEIAVKPCRVSLSSLCQSSLYTVQSWAECQNIALSCQCKLEDDYLSTDPARLGQILNQLLTNALKFTPMGGAITLELKHTSADEITISVIDTGIGIPPEQIQTLFRGFHQVEPSLTRRTGGLGIGLALSARLAQLLGGHITVESELGRGSKFALHLPAPGTRAAGKSR
ncbi:cell wall metabolism sensor histidine kinase WalK [Leptolyngbya sp. FACHB-261]|uniref:sensor histidine kinase n=1 Tax=Leptolyngbya sp. FACHB-261 TaxID=2692806 RepID=UPI0016844743|nr:HAMP domain-containing sensor histidine kinase [Leptolyngbya sp. FACHB-261]MBD2103753.1 HAMP domain-containing histidine kinase [Leptolyngbya sp. FACHB-261]